jgi:hypothetical protein
MLLKLSTARNAMVFMVDSSDHITGKASLTLTITASKDGAAFASITPTVTDRGSGWYSLALTTTHTDTLGDLALHLTGTGADPTDVVYQVVTALPGDAGSLTTTERNAIADALMVRATSSFEASAPAKSLGTAVMKLTHKVESVAGTLTVYRSDGSTTHATQTESTDAAAAPLIGLDGAV